MDEFFGSNIINGNYPPELRSNAICDGTFATAPCSGRKALMLVPTIVMGLMFSASVSQPKAEKPSTADETLTLLKQRKFKQLDAALNSIQARFEHGQATEFELRNAYRPFYDESPDAYHPLSEWASTERSSYPAHLARAINLRRRASRARGAKLIKDTPTDKIDEMEDLLAQAKDELDSSLTLTAQPYLSLINLMDITFEHGDQEEARRLIDKADAMVPQNMLARLTYLQNLDPRYGGSFEEAQAFIDASKQAGVNTTVLDAMSAVLAEERGRILYIDRHDDDAKLLFHKALVIGKSLDPVVEKDILKLSIKVLCSNGQHDDACP
ncbi:MAG: hypothetical protein JST54_00850 [Deltaproteobacteria bacterium]|nr:hypothetical protein [Deltaproteobacteria bacterium]